jgi:hypothetical protein
VCLSQISETHYSRLILLETFTCITFVKDSNAEERGDQPIGVGVVGK